LTKSRSRAIRTSPGGRYGSWAASAVGVAALVGSMSFSPAASAHADVGPTKVVVQVVNRAPFGNMLATIKGASLYTAPTSGCKGGCLAIWPPLYIVKGKIPQGVSDIGKVRVVVGGVVEHQVTYMGKPLYKFVDDSGTSVTGSGVGGFAVATVP
jgi:predicted lipoprotein with Yx(FWY)xxD motif